MTNLILKDQFWSGWGVGYGFWKRYVGPGSNVAADCWFDDASWRMEQVATAVRDNIY